jgi:hypothetical protein
MSPSRTTLGYMETFLGWDTMGGLGRFFFSMCGMMT